MRRGTVIAAAVAACLVVAGVHRLFAAAGTLPYFDDEMFITTAAYRFFQEVDYRSVYRNVAFDPQASTGIAGGFLTGLVWDLGGDLQAQRRLVGVFWSAALLALGWFALGRLKAERAVRALVLAFAWGVLLVFPYWFGVLHGLGEWPAFVYCAAGILCLPRRPRLGALCFGTAVFLTKLVYLPAVGMWLLAWVSVQRGGWRDRSVAAAEIGVAFVAPLAVWIALIFARFGVDGLSGAAGALASHVTEGPGFGLDLAGRLRVMRETPGSWASGGLVAIVQFLALTVLPFCAYAASRARLRDEAPLVRRLVEATVVALAAYAVWFFVFNPKMWARHYQPAHYIGFALTLFLAVRFHLAALTASLHRRVWLAPLAGGALLLLLALSDRARSSYAHRDPTYARSCRHPYSAACLIPRSADPAARQALFRASRRHGGYPDEHDLDASLH